MNTTTDVSPRIPARARPGSSRWRFFYLLTVLALCGCTAVQFISDYDEGIDKGITDFQKSVETYLVGIERAGRPAGPLTAADNAFFTKATVDLSALTVRASSLPKNDITIKMLSNLGDSMQTLEQLVQTGIAKEDVKSIRSALNISTGAILKLELAKKRPDSKSQ